MIYIIRHGQTQMNKEKVLQGRSDLPLDATGIEQTRAVALAFAEQGIVFDRVFSSPLQRAVQTAQLAAGPGVPVETDPRLLEMDYGPYEGVSLESPPAEILEFFSDFIHNPAPEGMEQLHSVVERLGDFLKDLQKNDHNGNILISTHAIAMKGALEYLTPGSSGAYWPKYIGNCAVYQTEILEGRYTVPVPFEIEKP